MKNTRKFHSKKFKTRVALETLSGLKTIAEIASKYELHPTQVSKWKRQLEENAESVFENGRSKSKETKESEKQVDELHRQIGEQKVAIDWLKKKVGLIS